MGRTIAWRLALVWVVLASAACAPAPRDAPAAPAPAGAAPAATAVPTPERLRLAYPNLSATFLPIFVARDQGFYAAEGVEVELLEMRANAGQAALMAGEVDFTASLGSNVKMALQGAPIKTILLYMNTQVLLLTAQPQYPTVASLRGRTVGVGVAGATVDQMARLTLKHYGLEPQRDVQVVSIGDAGVQYEALRLGQIDAAMLALPFPVLARREGYQLLVNTADILNLPSGGLGALQSTLEQRRDAVRRALSAQIRGLQYIRAQPEDSARVIAEFFGMDLETARESYALLLPAWTADGTVDRQGIEAIVQQEVADGTVAAPLPYEQLVDAAIAAEAQQALGRRGR